jgi:hypothetical protein
MSDADLAPAPDGGDLELMIQCRLDRATSHGKKHRVVIRSDWTVSTPHDLAAERVAAAFGGYTSCIELIDRTIPVFRKMLPVLSRQQHLALRRDASDGWRLPLDQQAAQCCRGHRFATIATAASHARSAAHIARVNDVSQWQLAALMSGASAAWGSWEHDPPSSPAIDRMVRESEGVAELWRAGVHPREVPSLAAAASAVGGPLPAAYYLGMVYAATDPLWLAEVVPSRPDADTAAWLAWIDLPPDRAEPAVWGGWLRIGLSRAEAQFAAEARLPSERIADIAMTIGWSELKTARCVVGWAKVGCFPTLAQFQALAHSGAESVEPSRTAIDTLVAEVDADSELSSIARPTVDRTQLAVMLAVLGTRHAVRNTIRTGGAVFEELVGYQRLREGLQ